MDPPPLDTARWKALEAISHTEVQSNWTGAQVARRAGISLEVAFAALNWLRERKLAELRVWLAKDSLYRITDQGRAALTAGAQLTLDAE